jgi:hypothetical protein
MDWRCDSSGRAPALQPRSPEFKRWYHHKKKKKSEPKNGNYQINPLKYYVYGIMLYLLYP